MNPRSFLDSPEVLSIRIKLFILRSVFQNLTFNEFSFGVFSREGGGGLLPRDFWVLAIRTPLNLVSNDYYYYFFFSYDISKLRKKIFIERNDA